MVVFSMPMQESNNGGLSGRKGKPKIHGEAKGKFNISLTPTAKNKLIEAANEAGISPSELIERWAKSPMLDQFVKLFSCFQK